MRFKSLDSWRGLCALAVVMFHFPIVGLLRGFPIFAHGYLFVDFFFALSGFVIATAWEGRLSQPDQIWRFLLRRFGRLWPLHVAILGVFVAVSLIQGDLGHDERHSVGAIVTNLFLVQGLGMHKELTWNGPSWSISVEAMLYLVFALLAPLRWRVWVYFGLIALGMGVLANWAPNGMASTFDYGIFRGLAGFFTGALLTRLRPVDLGWVGELVAVIGVGTFVGFNRCTILAPAVFGAAVYIFAHANGPLTRLLETTPFRKLGEWSYSTYMVHSLLVAVIWSLAPRLGFNPTASGHQLVSGSEAATAVIALAYVSGVVALSACTYAFIEKPARGWFNALAGARRPALAAE